MKAEDELVDETHRVAELLRRYDLRIVFAESCTAGLIAATLARIPGISDYLCGSAVVYRNATKQNWLGVTSKCLDDPGPVSREVAIEMAEGALDKTPEADLAASVTGHLGPDAPPDQDGLIVCAIAVRQASPVQPKSGSVVREHWLGSQNGESEVDTGNLSRVRRQFSAATRVLSLVRSWIEENGPKLESNR